MSKKILVSGAAGFIGFHLSKRLCENGHKVMGIDNLNNYYDVNLKYGRLEVLNKSKNFSFQQIDIADKANLNKCWEDFRPEVMINLAAQAGVRYSITNPDAYVESNLVGFMNILEASRNYDIKHLIFASSSSVYGANKKVPFSETDNVDHPVSLYAATKKSNELLAHSYSSLYNIPTTGLRFFTVYGPFGRPDMAYFKFTKNIIEDLPIDVYNNGDLERDFTYIDDIVEGIVRLLDQIPVPKTDWNYENPDPANSFAPYNIYNIGNNKPIKLLYFIETLEKILNKKAIKNYLPMQAGDVNITYANIDKLEKEISFSPNTPIETGLKNFIEWYKKYYKVVG